MIFLEINPLSKPVAISEMLILLAIAAFIGWLIGRWLLNGKIENRRRLLASREVLLNDCRNKSDATARSGLRETVKANKADNLKVIEGIGPKIEKLLKSNGILSLDQLANTAPSAIVQILQSEGSRFQMHDPTTWPQQAVLARDGKWDALAELQDKLDGGRLI